MNIGMFTREIYVKHTNVSGQSYHASHLVWDGAKFIAARMGECMKVNLEQGNGLPRKAMVQEVTREEYMAATKKGTK